MEWRYAPRGGFGYRVVVPVTIERLDDRRRLAHVTVESASGSKFGRVVAYEALWPRKTR